MALYVKNGCQYIVSQMLLIQKGTWVYHKTWGHEFDGLTSRIDRNSDVTELVVFDPTIVLRYKSTYTL